MAAENVFGPTRTNRSFAVDSKILWTEGYWVRTSVNVDLTKEEKVRIGSPSSPRWELALSARAAVRAAMVVIVDELVHGAAQVESSSCVSLFSPYERGSPAWVV